MHCAAYSVIPTLSLAFANPNRHIFCVQMKSVGEVMAIGRTWQESVQNALRGI
jgi:carbamoylphosphate synthase large subunit